jgi:hypothetical protein
MRPSNAATPAPAVAGNGRRVDLLGRPIDNENTRGADRAQYFSHPHTGAARGDLQSMLAFLSGKARSMTTPPLLMIAEGRRPRLRKAASARPSEIQLHMRVAALLRRRCRSDWQWTHPANGELRDKHTAAKLKQMGKIEDGNYSLVIRGGRL